MNFPRALILALAMVAAGAAAQAASLSANYDFYVSGIKVGTASFSSEESASSYSARARISTAGLLGAFVSFSYDGAAQGAISRGQPVPALFTATSVTSGKTKSARIDGKNGAPAKVTINPPRDLKFEAAALRDTLDPVTATFALLRDGPAERMCGTRVELFDGSRRARITLGARKAEKGGFACAGTYARLEGEGNSLVSARDSAFTLRFTQGADGMARLRRVETSTSFGPATLERRS